MPLLRSSPSPLITRVKATPDTPVSLPTRLLLQPNCPGLPLGTGMKVGPGTVRVSGLSSNRLRTTSCTLRPPLSSPSARRCPFTLVLVRPRDVLPLPWVPSMAVAPLDTKNIRRAQSSFAPMVSVAMPTLARRATVVNAFMGPRAPPLTIQLYLTSPVVSPLVPVVSRLVPIPLPT